MTTPTQPENTQVSESLSYDSFASIEWSNDDISPNNNQDYDNPRSSNYQTPTRGLREESYHDEHYRSPSIVDYYTDQWNRTTTFTPTNEDHNGDFTYHEPSGVHYYNNPGTKTSRVSMAAPAEKNNQICCKYANFTLLLHQISACLLETTLIKDIFGDLTKAILKLNAPLVKKK